MSAPAVTAPPAVSATTAETRVPETPWWLATEGPWLVDPIVSLFATILSIFLGALMVVRQQKSGNRTQMHLKVFEELQKGLGAASSASSTAGMWAFSAPRNLDDYYALLREMPSPSLPRSRTLDFFEHHGNASETVTDLISLLESYDIVSEHFKLFRRALACAISDVLDAHTALVPLLIRALPLEPPPGTMGSVYMPQSSEADRQAFRHACERYWILQSTVGNYIEDINNEAQNVLLNDIFDRRVPPRDPPDKSHWVLRTDDADYLRRLTKWFMEDHPASARARELDAELRRKYKGTGDSPSN